MTTLSCIVPIMEANDTSSLEPVLSPQTLSDHLLHYILTLFGVSVVLKSLSATTPVIRDISADDFGKGGR